jgi:hypothetical protein
VDKLLVTPSGGDVVGHPIKAFHVLKRLATDWRKIPSLVFNDSDENSATRG